MNYDLSGTRTYLSKLTFYYTCESRDFCNSRRDFKISRIFFYTEILKSRDGEFDPETNPIFLSRDLRSRERFFEIYLEMVEKSRDFKSRD
jgi:hypothetical protein